MYRDMQVDPSRFYKDKKKKETGLNTFFCNRDIFQKPIKKHRPEVKHRKGADGSTLSERSCVQYPEF